ncbi:GntR family transcriptional regulator [Bacillus sp. ISL-47]|uniref:GntR family transcriptional regulator n=1 Tax=Bacillus sp. ISL-47 TaxID=2819130 RepID=UPI001BE8078B|nr:GntR family transcriptional regulator [Bacillus sp. ISL-47]MBT2686720.1 GntR family transcriptional regulator [Bacillus sp. ISL-47]
MDINEILTEATTKTKSIKSLRDVVIEFLREAIFIGHYKPGDQLIERELSDLLGISTTPIKEALRVLSHDGLVETIPRKGTYVSQLVDTSIEEFMMVKAVLEGLAAKLAAIKISAKELELLEKQILIMKNLSEAKDYEQLVAANLKFHLIIREAAKNPIMFQTLNNVIAFDNAFRKRALKHNMEVIEGFNEHNQIFQAIKSRNPDLSEKLMKDHIMRTAVDVLNKGVSSSENLIQGGG